MNRYVLRKQGLLCLLVGWFAPLVANGTAGVTVVGDTIATERTDAGDPVVEAAADTTGVTRNDSLGHALPGAGTPAGEKINFNPLDYRLQKRFLEKGDTFKTRHFYERMYIGFYSGLQQMAPKGARDLGTAVPVAGFLGYEFTRLHSLRLSGSYMEYAVKGSNKSIKQLGLDLDYMFNVSSYLYGYRRRRMFQLSGLLGVGAIETHLNGEVHRVLKGQVGAHMAFRMGGNSEIFLEPFMALATDQVDHSGNANPSIYDVLYGVRAGLSLNFRSTGDYYKNTNYNGNLFFDFSQGAAMYYSRGGLPIIKTMGTVYQAAMGKWLNPVVGVRGSLSVSDFYYGYEKLRGTKVSGIKVRPTYEHYFKGYLFAARMEAMLNPVHFSPRWRKTPHYVDLNLLLGGEYGWMMKPHMKDTPGALKCYYKGITGAMQLLYNVNTSTSVFVEPRALMAVYNVPYKNSAQKKSYTDKIGYVSAGVRVTRPTRAERVALGKHHFEPYLFVGAQLGGIRQMRNDKFIGDKGLNGLGAINVGYQYAPLAAAKLQLEYMLLNKNKQTPYQVRSGGRTYRYNGMWRHQYGYLNAKLAYMLNLTNLYQRYNPSRRLNLYGQGGPMLSLLVTQGAKLYSQEMPGGENPKPVVTQRTGEKSWALFGGMIADYRILDRWSIYAEPEVQCYLNAQFPTFDGRRINTIVLKFSVGTTYRF